MPLSATAFASFGDVIEAGESGELINQGTTLKYADLAELKLTEENGRPAVHVYYASPCNLPFHVEMMERHPLSSQLFMPLSERPILVVVAPAGDGFDSSQLRAFVSNGRQGVNYHPGTWHHPLLALEETGDFLVVDRVGPGDS